MRLFGLTEKNIKKNTQKYIRNKKNILYLQSLLKSYMYLYQLLVMKSMTLTL